MSKTTKKSLLAATKRIFAEFGYEGLSMRRLAAEAQVSLSVTYHHYKDKDELLNHVFRATTKQLGQLRAKMPRRATAQEMLRDRIAFQIKHSEDVVFVLKYYMHFRHLYSKNESGYLPEKAYRHIVEVLAFGQNTNEFYLHHPIEKEAKIVAHAINGFLLEYYPAVPSPSEEKELISSITDFVFRALKGGDLAVPTQAKT